MQPIVIVDHPVLAEALALFVEKHIGASVMTTTSNPTTIAPPDAVVLLEQFLPERQRGLIIARQLQQSRPDLTCVVWSREPAPLHVWAALEYKINGCLDKAMPASDILYWLECAINNRSAWPGHMLAQARAWEQEVAVRLKALNREHWQLWGRFVHGDSNKEIGAHLNWSPRTIERRSEKLYEVLGVQSRSEAVGAAWQWGLVRPQATGPEWSYMVQELFPLAREAEYASCW